MRVRWNLQQLNLGGMTSGPAAVGDPSSFLYAGDSQIFHQRVSLRVNNRPLSRPLL
jgi:hypothetical protein